MSHHSRSRIVFVAALIALATLTVLTVAPAASAAKPCAEKVVADWYGDGRVDAIFPIPCYRAAIRSLPVDALDYSRAEEDILRALAYRKQNKPDPGPTGGAKPSDDGTGGSGANPGDPGSPGEGGDAAEGVDTSGPSSLPIPLLVLGAFALLLLAAGGVGYLSRRAQSRRDGGPPGPA